MRYLILLSLPLIAISISAESSSPIKQAPQPLDPAASGVGLLVKDVKFETFDGKSGRLRDFNDRKATVVAFTGPNCPLSKSFAPILAAIEDTYSKKGVSFLFIDPTFIKNSERDLKELSNEVGFDGPVVLDKDESLTQTFGAKTTTEVFVLDGACTLLYRGAVDDRYGLGYQRDDARQHYLIEVLD
ncbi:MAG: redoxin family protein, partial [Opitutae bacterium]